MPVCKNNLQKILFIIDILFPEYQELQILKKRKHSSFIVTEIAEEATEVMDIDKSTSGT